MKMKNKNRGITLVEVLIAITIVAFAAVAIIQVYISSISLSEINKEEAVAVEHLTNIMEAIKCTPFNSITTDFPDGFPDGPASNEYSALTGDYALAGEQIVVSYVDPASDPLEIIASLSWQDKRGIDHTKYLVTKRTR